MHSSRASIAALAAIAALATGLAACGDGKSDRSSGTGAATTPTSTKPLPPGKVEVVKGLGGGTFDPAAIYRREAPGVVTVISEVSGGQRGLGSGFVISGDGEVATNAHVVSEGQGSNIEKARAVYVQFADGNQVPAKIVGIDPNSDVGLIRVDPAGLTLHPLPLGSSANLIVGAPVAAIGSPFAEPQSLTVGVISGTDRTIDSLTSFQISDAIQTDASINHGNSGGPLIDAHGRVVGINSQVAPGSSGGEGVGFAVPVDTVRRSLDQLRAHGHVVYAYIGISSTPVFPQLARHFGLGADHGAWVQEVVPGGPAQKAGIRAGGNEQRFQARPYAIGGDVIVRVGGREIREDADVSRAIASLTPGRTVDFVVFRDGRERTIRVKLGSRPAGIRRP
jgi:2-alkenal reductase